MHEIWDDTKVNPGTLPFVCDDCGDGQIAVVEFRRNEKVTQICFDCVRNAAADVEQHEATEKDRETATLYSNLGREDLADMRTAFELDLATMHKASSHRDCSSGIAFARNRIRIIDQIQQRQSDGA